MSISQMLPEALAAKYREFLKPFEGHTQAILDSRIVEMGSNANGEYVRWENGLQIAIGEKRYTDLALTIKTGELYRARISSPPTTPASFTTRNIAYFIKNESINTDCTIISVSMQARSNILDVYVATLSESVDITLAFIAIGRWK